MKTKRFIAAMLAALMIVVMIPAAALTASAEGDWSYTERADGTIMLTAYNAVIDGALTIPATYDGKTVYGIASEVLKIKGALTSVTVSEGIKYIGDWCFALCTKLESVSLPSTLEELGSGAFTFVKDPTIELPAACKTFSVDTNCGYYSNASYGNNENKYPFFKYATGSNPKTVICYTDEAVAMLKDCNALSVAANQAAVTIDRRKMEKDGGSEMGAVKTNPNDGKKFALGADCFVTEGTPNWGVSDTSNLSIDSVDFQLNNEGTKLYVTAVVNDENQVIANCGSEEWNTECFELMIDPTNEAQADDGREKLLQLRINTQNQLSGRWLSDTIGGAYDTLPTGTAFDGKFAGSVSKEGSTLTYQYTVDISEFEYEDGDEMGIDMHAVSCPDAENAGWQYISYYKRLDGNHGVWDATMWDYVTLDLTPYFVDGRRKLDPLPANPNIGDVLIDGWRESTYKDAGLYYVDEDDSNGSWWAIRNGFVNFVGGDFIFCLKSISFTLSEDMKTLYFFTEVKDNVTQGLVGTNPWEREGIELYIDPYGDTDPAGDYLDKLLIIRIGKDGSLTGSWLGREFNDPSIEATATLPKPATYEGYSWANAGHYVTNSYQYGGKTLIKALMRNGDGKDYTYDVESGFSAGDFDPTFYCEGTIDVSEFGWESGKYIAWQARALDYATETGSTTNQFAYDGHPYDILATNYWHSMQLTDDEWLYKVINEEAKTAMVYKYTGTETDITVPGTLEGYTIIEIARELFFSSQTVTYVTLPESIMTLPESAFAYCKKLSGVSYSGLTFIPDKCFYLNRATTAVTIPSTVEHIGSRAFMQDNGLKTVTIENGSRLKTINYAAFGGCTSLLSINLPEGLERIVGGTAQNVSPFNLCYNMSSITIPSTVLTVETNTFTNCWLESGANQLRRIFVPNDETVFQEDSVSGSYYASIYSNVGSKSWAFARAVTDQYMEDNPTDTKCLSGARHNCDISGTENHHALYISSRDDVSTEYHCYCCDFYETRGKFVDKVCGTADSTVAAGAHTYTTTRTKLYPTCTEEGAYYVTCATCGFAQSDTPAVMEATGHTPGNWNTTQAGNCAENIESVQVQNCTVCGEQIGERRSLHDTETNRHEPGYSHEGSIDEVCRTCGKTIESTPIPKLDITKKFSDVPNGTYFTDHVAFCLDNGYVAGTTPTTFAPALAMTRASLVIILYRMEDSPEVEYSAKFKDVADNTWFTDAVMWASKEGIVTGDAGRFRPADSITRQEIAAILFRYAKYKDQDVSEQGNIAGYADYSKLGAWAREAMSWANAKGIITGNGNNLMPAKSASRAEVVTMLARYINAYLAK